MLKFAILATLLSGLSAFASPVIYSYSTDINGMSVGFTYGDIYNPLPQFLPPDEAFGASGGNVYLYCNPVELGCSFDVFPSNVGLRVDFRIGAPVRSTIEDFFPNAFLNIAGVYTHAPVTFSNPNATFTVTEIPEPATADFVACAFGAVFLLTMQRLIVCKR